MKTKTVTEMSYRELEDLVKSKLGYKQYTFVAVEECGNDSTHEFDVDGVIDEYDQKTLDNWAAGKFETYSNGAILNKLCADGHIPAGDYLVDVCW